MAFNGSGLFNIDSTGQPVSANTLIESSVFNALTADLATGLSNCVTKNGETTVTANLPMATYRHTGVGNATARTMYAAAGQVQDNALCYGTVGGTADVITLTLTPSITAYAAGQKFAFIASGANTTNVTLNVNGVGAKAITKNGTTALTAGNIPSGAVVVVLYDGTQFQLIAPATAGLQQLDYSTDIASAATVDLGTATGNSVTVTHASGTTATTSFGGATTVQKGTIIAVTPLISGGTYSLTHHATNLNLAGGADITLASGDTLLMRKEHDSNAEWKHVGGAKADGTAWVTSGNVKLAGDTVQVVEATPYTTAGSTATAIPLDSTIPQNTEGAELTTVTITPTSASNRLRIECNLPFLDGSGGIFMCAALFQDSTANALALGVATLNAANYAHNINFVHEMAAGTTSATTFKLRAGPNAGTMYFNRRQAGETLGGVSACRIRVTEIQV